MLHLNEYLKKPHRSLIANICGNFYSAVSIADFLENKSEIEPSGISLLGLLGCANMAAVIFNGVEYVRGGIGNPHSLQDITGKISVGLHTFSDTMVDVKGFEYIRGRGFVNRYDMRTWRVPEMRLYSATILYDVKRNRAYFAGCRVYDNDKPESESSFEGEFAFGNLF